MELKDFIKTTLQQVVLGVAEAKGKKIAPEFLDQVISPTLGRDKCKSVEFDVLIGVTSKESTASDTSLEGTGNASAGISVLNVIEVGDVSLSGNVTKSDGKMAEQNENRSSRIKFSIPIDLHRIP